MQSIWFNLVNTTGSVRAFKTADGKIVTSLSDIYDGDEVDISEKLWKALVEEFGLDEE